MGVSQTCIHKMKFIFITIHFYKLNCQPFFLLRHLKRYTKTVTSQLHFILFLFPTEVCAQIRFTLFTSSASKTRMKTFEVYLYKVFYIFHKYPTSYISPSTDTNLTSLRVTINIHPATPTLYKAQFIAFKTLKSLNQNYRCS